MEVSRPDGLLRKTSTPATADGAAQADCAVPPLRYARSAVPLGKILTVRRR